MTGPSKHYPDMALKKARDAVCRACPVDNADVCWNDRKAGICPFEEGIEEMLLKFEHEKRAIVPPTQTRLPEPEERPGG